MVRVLRVVRVAAQGLGPGDDLALVFDDASRRPRWAAARTRPCRARRSCAPGCGGRRSEIWRPARLRGLSSFGTLRSVRERACVRARPADCRHGRQAVPGQPAPEGNMSKTIIIAEKPSVAQDIVRALTPLAGKFEKHAEHFESDSHVVTSAVGHLVEIKAPDEYEVKRGKWSFAHLPVVPPHFDVAPIDKAKTRLNAVVKLVKRKDVTAHHQRLRRRARGRADLPPDPAVRLRRQGLARQADPAPVAAEHDAAGHPRRPSSSCAATSRCAAWPTPRAAAARPTGWWASTARAR